MTLLCTGQLRSLLDFILLQIDVDAICKWISLNYLILNILKCCYMIFTRKRYPILPTTSLMVNNLALAKVDSCKYLGVHLLQISPGLNMWTVLQSKQEAWWVCFIVDFMVTWTHIIIMVKLYIIIIHPSTFRIRLHCV